MLNDLTYTALATVIIDIIAMFLLLGLIQLTRIYRQRGKLKDKIFFAMLLTDLLMTVTDISVELMNFSTVRALQIIMVLTATILTMAFEILCFLVFSYLYCSLPGGDEKLKNSYKLYAVPAAASIIMLLINIFGGFLFYADSKTGQYLHGPVYELVFVPVVIYAVMCIRILWDVNRQGIFLFFMLLVVRLGLESCFKSVSSTPFVYAVILIYLLVGTMNRSFHGEEEND